MKEAIKTLFVNIANLFKVMTIISLSVVFTTCYLTINKVIAPETFIAITGTIIAFYFSRETKKEIEIKKEGK